MNHKLTVEAIEKINRERFEDYGYISKSYVFGSPEKKSTGAIDYFKEIEEIRLQLIKEYGRDKEVLDLCCGVGNHLLRSRCFIKKGIGIDLSRKMIQQALAMKNQARAGNIEFIESNAKQIPFADATFDLVYSFSSLYYIPSVQQVILEAARILRPGSIAILEFGNLHSLNTIVCQSYPELALPFHIKIKEMKRIIRNAGLEIVGLRRFQILPLWGERPVWLKPLLLPFWKRFMQKEIKGKMLDEWLSNMLFFKCFSFRHTIICKKGDI
jgi:SAM-dependent methyltransferase